MNRAEKSTVEENEIMNRIVELKEKLGESLVILTHHYQRKEIVDIGHYQGDSFGLSQQAAADEKAKYIVFCGVHFMAESAAILAREHQRVQIPDLEAGCWMADMADHYIVERAWKEALSVVGKDSFTPIVYMNSDAWIKAMCGAAGGLVCTSSNAPAAFKWAFSRREKIFFFPDHHLGRNTANRLNIPRDEIAVWNPDEPLGGNTEAALRKAKVVVWDGYCLVHTRFKTGHMVKMRESRPEAKIVVHPECTEDVVALADAVGSTSFIVKYVEKAEPGSTVAIGTEINLVERLAAEHTDKTVIPLHRSFCPNMFKIAPENLLATLENIGESNIVTVPEDIRADAKLALDRMLALPSA